MSERGRTSRRFLVLIVGLMSAMNVMASDISMLLSYSNLDSRDMAISKVGEVIEREAAIVHLDGEIRFQRQAVLFAEGALELSKKLLGSSIRSNDVDDRVLDLDIARLELLRLNQEKRAKEWALETVRRQVSGEMSREESVAGLLGLWRARRDIVKTELKANQRRQLFFSLRLKQLRGLLKKEAIARMEVLKVQAKATRVKLKEKILMNYNEYIGQTLGALQNIES